MVSRGRKLPGMYKPTLESLIVSYCVYIQWISGKVCQEIERHQTEQQGWSKSYWITIITFNQINLLLKVQIRHHVFHRPIFFPRTCNASLQCPCLLQAPRHLQVRKVKLLAELKRKHIQQMINNFGPLLASFKKIIWVRYWKKNLISWEKRTKYDSIIETRASEDL